MKKIICLLLTILLLASTLPTTAVYAEKSFPDVQKSHWFYNDVQRLVGLGAISGFPDGTFRPQESISRAAFIKILVSSLKLPASGIYSFEDTKNHWAKDVISIAIANGVIIRQEYGSRFEPDKPVTRLEMAKMMVRALKIDVIKLSSPFVDVDNDFINVAYEEYLVNGSSKDGKKMYYPNNSATRAEASAIVVRTVDYKADPDAYRARFIAASNEYDALYEEVRKAVKERKFTLELPIKEYDREKFKLGDVILKLNKEELAQSGYYTEVSFINVQTNVNPKIVQVWFNYPRLTGSFETVLANDSRPILKSSREWYTFIKNALEKGEERIVYNLTYSLILDKDINIVLDQHPDINYIEGWSISSNGIIGFKYKYSKESLQGIRNKTSEKAKQAVAQVIKPDMSETDKARAIHDYIVKNTKYDYDNFLRGTIPQDSYTAYGVLIKGVGVCQGYAAAFNLMAKIAGIKSIGVSGEADGGGHAWNMVKLDGKIGYIDVTWDDPVPDQGDRVRYNYFNISEEQIKQSHKWDYSLFNETYLDY